MWDKKRYSILLMIIGWCLNALAWSGIFSFGLIIGVIAFCFGLIWFFILMFNSPSKLDKMNKRAEKMMNSNISFKGKSKLSSREFADKQIKDSQKGGSYF